MTAADQIAEINAQFAERVKLLERERDAKVAMVRERCKHAFVFWSPEFGHSGWDGCKMGVEHCAKCGAPMQ